MTPSKSPPAETKQAVKIILHLNNAEIRPYIDHRKLVRSKLLADCLDWAVQVIDRDRNTNIAMELVNLFSETIYFRPVLYWLCDRSGHTHRIVKGSVKIVLNANPQPKQVSLLQYLTEFKGNRLDVLADDGVRKKGGNRRGPFLVRAYGSFGSGKGGR